MARSYLCSRVRRRDVSAWRGAVDRRQLRRHPGIYAKRINRRNALSDRGWNLNTRTMRGLRHDSAEGN